jgi:putative peptidoglycan lipid II flippase
MPDIARGVRAFTIGTAISRVLGLVRESVFAFLFGAGFSTDAFNAAFRIPNLMRDLFAETALSAAYIPILSEVKQKSRDEQNKLASNIFLILLIVVGLVVAAGIIFSPVLVRIITYGFGAVPNKLALTSQLTAVMFPFLLFIALAAWAMGYLNTEKEFFVPSVAPAFFNIISIAIPVILYMYFTRRGMDPIFGMAIGVTAGGFMQFLIQIPRLYRSGFRFHLYLNVRDPNIKRIFLLFIPVAFGLAASRINVTVDLFLISFLQERSMTWLNYAFRVMHLPLGLFGIAVGTVALPTISQQVAENRHAEVRETFFDSLKLVLFLTVSSALIIAFLAHPVTRLIYERGRFTAFDTAATAQALILYIVGIPFIAGIRNCAAAFYAYKDTRTPMIASFIAVTVHIIMNLILMRIIGFLAFPLSTTVSSAVNMIILLALLPRKIGIFRITPLLVYLGKLVIAGCGGGVVGLLSSRALMQTLGTTFLSQVATVAAGGIAGFLILFLACRVLGVREAQEYIARLLKR